MIPQWIRKLAGESVVLFASIRKDEWKESFLQSGVIAGQIEGEAGDAEEVVEPAILVQMNLPFHLITGEFVVVEFRKSLDEVYVDWDYEPEAWVDYDAIPEGAKTYADLDLSKMPSGTTLFGAYVKDIKPGEIIKVHRVEGREHDKEGLSLWKDKKKWW